MALAPVPSCNATADNKTTKRIVMHLQNKGNYLAVDPLNHERILLVAGASQPSVIRGAVPAAIVVDMQRNGSLMPIDRSKARLGLSSEGQALARRLMAVNPDDAFQQQHQRTRVETVVSGDARVPVRVNDSESPIAWLHRRRNRDGSPMLDSTRFAAGERLRVDLTRAQMMPRVTANWNAAVSSSARGSSALDPTESMIAARQRVSRAMEAVGPDMAGVLIDVCGFLKGLADIERDRNWPARSGKVVLDIALGRLASHYGLRPEARGPVSGKGIVSWAASDARPGLDSVQAAPAAS
ncbi:MAG: DUF6456 domain-containing protein [Beijerinckiaceae bacterium]